MNHKRRKPKNQRAGCLMCKWYKDPPYAQQQRTQAKREAFKHEERGG